MKNFITLSLLLLSGLNFEAAGKTNDHRRCEGLIVVNAKARSIDTNAKFNVTLQPFAPGEIKVIAPRNSAPAFAPAGDMVFLGQSQLNGDCAIMRSSRNGDTWSDLQTASFSGKYRDLEPAFSPDGKYLIFASNRPAIPSDSVLTGHYNGQVMPARGGNLWKVAFSDKGATAAERLPDMINGNSNVFSPSIVSDGSLYFMRADSGGKFHIYRSQNKRGKYMLPVKLPFTLDDSGDYDPVVAPDESFIIFSSSRPPAPKVTDLFIVFRNGDGWSRPADLRYLLSKDVFGIEARLSPDLQTLYFSNSQNISGEKVPNEQYIWRIDISALLKAHGIHFRNTSKSK